MKSGNTQKTCDERIDDHMNARLEELLPDVESWGVLKCARHLKSDGQTLSTADLCKLRDEVRETIRERASESLLSVEKISTYTLCLSWGGPADYFELDWSEDSRAWSGGRYVFQDWFDGANRSITTEQAEQLAELYGIYPDTSV